MKRRIVEWIVVLSVLGGIGYFLQVGNLPIVDGKDELIIVSDLPEPVLRKLLFETKGSSKIIVLPPEQISQWETLIGNQKPDLFVGSQTFLLWASRQQYLQPLRTEERALTPINAQDNLGRWLAIWVDPWVVIYNPERMPQGVQKSDLTWLRKPGTPQFRWVFPDIGSPENNSSNLQFYRILANHMGQETFYNSLQSFRPEIQQYVENSAHGVRMVLLGQVDFSLARYSDWVNYKRDKLPVDWTEMEFSPATYYGAGIGRETKKWEEANSKVAFWLNPSAEWDKKVELPWLSMKDRPKESLFGVGGLRDLEDQGFFDAWLAQFRFGTPRKEL